MGPSGEALASTQASIAVLAQLCTVEPCKAEWRSELATTYGRAATLMVKAERQAEAAAAFEKARTLLTPLVAAAPGDQKLITYLDKVNDILKVLGK